MKLLNLKSAIVGLMVVAVMSLNFVTPFSSQSYDDVKGMATEIPMSAADGQAVPTYATHPTTVSLLLFVVTRTLVRSSISVDAGLLDGSLKVNESSVMLSKLD